MSVLFLQNLTNLNNKSIILASQSPRRRDLLNMVGLQFSVQPATSEVPPTTYKDPVDYVRQTAYGKLIDVYNDSAADLVIAADTIVVLGGRIFEKPRDRDDAVSILQTLSGRTHEVITSICLKTKAAEIIDHSSTAVTFNELTLAEIEQYLATEEPFDKAGAYGIQGYGAIFINKIDGCYFNVMGFPLSCFYKNLLGLKF